MKLFNRWRYGKYINSEILIKWLEDQINREVENEKEKSCAIWKRLIKGMYTPYICDMVAKFFA